MALCDLFVSRYRVNNVYICKLVPRFTTRHCPVDLNNKLIIVANQLLKQDANKRSRVMYWKRKGLKNSKTENLCDGVHMNYIGNIKYYRAIRGAVLHAIKQHEESSQSQAQGYSGQGISADQPNLFLPIRAVSLEIYIYIYLQRSVTRSGTHSMHKYFNMMNTNLAVFPQATGSPATLIHF